MRRWLLGAATFWPLLYIVFFVAIVGAATVAGGGEPDNELLVPMPVLFGLHLATMVLIIALMIIYIRDAYRTPEVPDDRRTFWAVVLFMGNAIAMPIYWWLYMRPGRATKVGSDVAEPSAG